MGARGTLEAASATALLFSDEGNVSATVPEDAAGFALRDGSIELRRLFLHALSRFGEEARCSSNATHSAS